MKIQKIKLIRIAAAALCAIIIFSLMLSAAVTGIPGAATAYADDYYLRETSSKAEAFEKANTFNEELCEEGIVLLKNENGALPLATGNKVSMFGKNSVNLVYGGTGSSGGDSTHAKTLDDSLSAAGLICNPVLKTFYENTGSGTGRPASPQMASEVLSISTGETPQSSYPDLVKNSYNDYKDAAIVVISRIGGEGFDLPQSSADDNGRHYLELDTNEIDLIREVCSAGFGKVVVVINSANVMELGFVTDGTYGNIDACLWMGFPGSSGVMALGRVLNGTVNPSGRTVDTWARDFKKDPTWANFANNGYVNGASYTVNGNNQLYRFVDYEEGIYTGYRYYETRGFTEGGTWYDDNVVYPFGYGLSYTAFSWELADATSIENKTISRDGLYSIDVKVTNIGDRMGKDVVQMYCTPPYFGGIEKAHKVLCGFVKTGIIFPGESETVTLKFSPYDIASYDYSDVNTNGIIGYELDGGNYKLCLQRNAHEVNLDIRFTVGTYGIKFDIDPTTGCRVENRFGDADDQLSDVLSRGDWATTWPAVRTGAERAVTQTFIDKLADVTHNNPNEYSEMPLQGINDNMKLSDLISASYDDPRWDSLLDILTVDEMQDLVNKGAFRTVAVPGISKPATIDADGSAGFVSFIGDGSVYGTCYYACEVVAASTWNTELLYTYGKSLGEEALWGDEKGSGNPYSGLYAPGVNIHRSPFGGRNFEYYSEDGYLSGEMAAAVIQGAQSKGLTMYVKHFALNEQETNRSYNGLATWATEQAVREIYLKPFEKAVKNGKARGIMTGYNRIGTKWAGGDYRLLTDVLRYEWGFRGTVISEFNLSTYMNVKQMVYAGGDLNFEVSRRWNCDKSDPGDVTVLRLAAKNILYTVVNSNAMNFEEESKTEPKIPLAELLPLLTNLYDSLENLIKTLPNGSGENIAAALNYLAADIAEIEKLLTGSSYFEDFYIDYVKENAPLYVMVLKVAAAEITLSFENAGGDIKQFTEDLYVIVKNYLTYFELMTQGEGYDMNAVREAVDTAFTAVLTAIDKIYEIIGYPVTIDPIEPPVDPVEPTPPTDNPTPAEPNPTTPIENESGCFSTIPAAGIAAAIGMIITVAALMIIITKKKKQR